MKTPYGLSADCSSCHLRPAAFFCALSLESVKDLDQIRHPAVFPAEAAIFVEGQAARGVFLLCHGQVKLSITSREGRTLILRIAKPGEVLGLHAVVTGKPYTVAAETMQASKLAFVHAQDFLSFLKAHGDACLQAAQHISRECQDAYNVVRSIGLSRSVHARVAKFLLESVMNRTATNGEERSPLGLTHEDIAQLTGTTRETVTRILSEFKRKNIVELKGSNLTIHNKAVLERLATADA